MHNWQIRKNPDGTIFIDVEKLIFSPLEAETLSRDINRVAAGRAEYQKSPNAVTIRAMMETYEGTLDSFDSVDELMEDLNNDTDVS